MEEFYNKIKKDILKREENLSSLACKSKDAIFLREDIEKENESRPAFSKDTDRIIHSLSYTRYIDKTQVYSFIENDHITHRVLHVQLVSKIARTIGKILNLNQPVIAILEDEIHNIESLLKNDLDNIKFPLYLTQSIIVG